MIAIYQRPDTGLSLSLIIRERAEDESEEEFLEAAFRRIETAIPNGTRIGIVSQDIVDAMYGSNRDFRNAWRWEDTLVVDFSIAQELTKERLRAERVPLLTSLDTEYLRALEQGGDTSSIIAEKQRLRDITSLVDSAATLEELRLITV